MHTQRTCFYAQSLVLVLALAGCDQNTLRNGKKPENTPGGMTGAMTGVMTGATGGMTGEMTGFPFTGGESGGEETGGGECELNDAWEPNSDAETASLVPWQSAQSWGAWVIFDAYLCAGESDWYRFSVASLGYGTHNLRLRALVKDAGLCGVGCDEPVIPAGPEHAMNIEIYQADTMQLVGLVSDDDGVLKFNGEGENFSQDLLLHVFSPTPDASYPYHLTLSIANYEGEDECEC